MVFTVFSTHAQAKSYVFPLQLNKVRDCRVPLVHGLARLWKTLYKQGCRQGGTEALPDFKLMLATMRKSSYTAKGRPKSIIEKREKKNSFQVISRAIHPKIKA